MSSNIDFYSYFLDSVEDGTPSYSDPQTVSVMLGLLKHLRHQDISLVKDKATKWEQNFWLPSLNYLHAAQAALSRSAHFSAVLYADIWCQSQRLDSQCSGSFKFF